MSLIKFGTDGWRAIIAKDYTVDNLMRVTKATADWLNEKYDNPIAVIGYDCRFGGQMFQDVVIQVLCSQGVKVIISDSFSSTPMVSLAAKKLGANIGVVITASHNPPSYNGFKLKGHYGGPSLPNVISEIENLIPESTNLLLSSVDEYKSKGFIEVQNLEQLYLEHAKSSFNLDKIKSTDIHLAYDAMYGAGQSIVKRLFDKNVSYLHAEFNPSFNDQAPEPLHKNLSELSALIKGDNNLKFGFATDGDADRIGVYDENGVFIDSHHVILLLVHYLHKYKDMDGKVVISFSCSNKIKKLCEVYGLQYEITKIGFKYICGHMVDEDVLVGGEESGGIAVKGHVPERDGVWNALLLLEFMAETGKTISELIQEVYDIVGSFSFERNDLHIDEDLKLKIVENCKNNTYNSFGSYTVQSVESVDGFKFFFEDDSWVMIRPSGTEPVLRVYAEAENIDKVNDILSSVKATLLS